MRGGTRADNRLKEIRGSGATGPDPGTEALASHARGAARAQLSLYRGRLLTESYRETQSFSAPIRRAKGFANVVKGIPLFLADGDLLAGAFAARPMAPEFFLSIARPGYTRRSITEASERWWRRKTSRGSGRLPTSGRRGASGVPSSPSSTRTH